MNMYYNYAFMNLVKEGGSRTNHSSVVQWDGYVRHTFHSSKEL